VVDENESDMAKLERASAMLEKQVESLKEQQEVLLPETDRLRDDIEVYPAIIESCLNDHPTLIVALIARRLKIILRSSRKIRTRHIIK